MTDTASAEELSALRAEVADLRNFIDDWMEATAYAIDAWGRDIHSRLDAAHSTGGKDQSRLAKESPHPSSSENPGRHANATVATAPTTHVRQSANGATDDSAKRAMASRRPGANDKRQMALSLMASGATPADAAAETGASLRSCQRWRAAA